VLIHGGPSQTLGGRGRKGTYPDAVHPEAPSGAGLHRERRALAVSTLPNVGGSAAVWFPAGGLRQTIPTR